MVEYFIQIVTSSDGSSGTAIQMSPISPTSWLPVVGDFWAQMIACPQTSSRVLFVEVENFGTVAILYAGAKEESGS